jgi:hypothetical protein
VTRVLESREQTDKRSRLLTKLGAEHRNLSTENRHPTFQRILSRTSSFDSTYTAESPFQSNPLLVKAGLHIQQCCWQYCSRLFGLLSTTFYFLNLLVLSNIAGFIARLKACANRA